MALVDDRGRLFGRINLIDALVGGLVIAAIPLAYAAYALFRQPQPSLTGIEPSTITPTTANVTVRGENLRPFLRVSFGQHQGVTFSLSTPTTAEVKVPELPAGEVQPDPLRRRARGEPAAQRGYGGSGAAAVGASEHARGGRVRRARRASAAEVVKGAELTAMGGNVVKVLDVGAAGGDTRWVQVDDVQVEVPLDRAGSSPHCSRRAAPSPSAAVKWAASISNGCMRCPSLPKAAGLSAS